MNIPLSEEQEAVVRARMTCRNVVVVAPPGSGKTRVLLASYKAQVEGGLCVPAEVAMITYTQAAAAELSSRIKTMGVTAPGFVGTLHGFLLAVVRDFGSKIGISKTMAVVDERTAMEVLDAQAKIVRFPGGRQQAMKAVEKRDIHNPRANALFCAYHETLASQGLLDFNGIIMWGQKVLAVIEGRTFFKHFYVDEYQDISVEDDMILDMLEAETRFVIGDPRQAIFGFRGGDYRMLMSLITDPIWQACALTVNFRSDPSICAVANQLAPLLPLPGIRIQPHSTKSVPHCIAFERVLNGEHQWDAIMDFFEEFEPTLGRAVICRYNWQLQEMAQYLTRKGIPFRTNAARKKPGNWDAARALVAFLGSPDSPALAYSLAVLTIGAKGAAKMKEQAVMDGVSMQRKVWCGEIPEFDQIESVLESFNLRGESFAIVMEAVSNLPANERTWQGLSAALADPSVLSSAQDKGTGSILLTTIHGSKGREFGVVACPYWNDQLFPGNRKDPESVPEESRLAYVAITRAIHGLIVVSTDSSLPYPNARTEVPMVPSRFIAMMEGRP